MFVVCKNVYELVLKNVLKYMGLFVEIWKVGCAHYTANVWPNSLMFRYELWNLKNLLTTPKPERHS